MKPHNTIQCDRNYHCLVAGCNIICYSDQFSSCNYYSQQGISQDVKTSIGSLVCQGETRQAHNLEKSQQPMSAVHPDENKGWFKWEDDKTLPKKMTLDDYCGGNNE